MTILVEYEPVRSQEEITEFSAVFHAGSGARKAYPPGPRHTKECFFCENLSGEFLPPYVGSL
jgi:hypothetical protein